ncbi:MAG: hypothetical protein QOJ18_556, partial [Microbacteriaceae bacterium]|nr:hypothetical protein [Microbacteriaceae bacterium]
VTRAYLNFRKPPLHAIGTIPVPQVTLVDQSEGLSARARVWPNRLRKS